MTKLHDPNRVHLHSDIDHLTAHIERMWWQLRGGHPHQPQFSPPVLRPPVDIYQTPEEVVVVVEVPGMQGQDVRLEVDADRLTIRGEKRNRHCEGEHHYSQMEIACGPFQRTVQLPAEVDPQGTRLQYEDGYIEIHMPRLARRLERHVRFTVRPS